MKLLENIIEYANNNKIDVDMHYEQTNMTLYKKGSDIFVDVYENGDVRVEKGFGERYSVLYQANFLNQENIIKTINTYL
jgi:hypothetical protein